MTTSDSGTIATTINGTAVSYAWGSGSTANSIASGLAAAINAQDSGFLSARVSSGTVLLTSTQTGTAENWAVSCSVGDTSGAFSTVSFATSCNGMSGGANASPAPPPVYTPATVYSYTIPAGGYAANNNLLSVSDSVMGNWAYGYDNLNRLITAQASANAQGYAPYGSALLNWSYDSFGNDEGQALSGSTGAVVGQGSYTYTGNNRMVGYSYDASGNLLSNNLSSNYTYDAEGRLAAVGSVGYVYDAEGRRVAKLSGTTPTNIYLLGLNGEQVSELDGSGNWLRSDAYAGSKLLATYTPSGLHFHFTDWLGSRRVQGNVAGTVEETCQSLPYGDSLNCTGTDATELHFTNKPRDIESGLDYFGARYYASSMGRFMSPDWSAKAQAVPYAKLTNPQTLNLYGYMQNNPLGGVDQDGHCDWCQSFGNWITGNGWQTNAQIAQAAALNAPSTITETQGSGTLVTNTSSAPAPATNNVQLGPGMQSAIDAEKSNGLVDLGTATVGAVSAIPNLIPALPALMLGTAAGIGSSTNDQSTQNISTNGTGAVLSTVGYFAEGTAVGTGATYGALGVAAGGVAWSASNFISNIVTSVFSPPGDAINAGGTTMQQPELEDIPQ